MAFNASMVTADAFAVTKSDSTVITAFGFYVGVQGDVAVTTALGHNVTFTAVPAGQIIPLAISKVLSTGTTATNIVGFGPT